MDDKQKIDEAARLTIQKSEDGVNSTYTWSADDLDQLSDLLRMSGINANTQVVNATVTADSGPNGPVMFQGESSSANMARIMAIIDRPDQAAIIGMDTAEPCGCEVVGVVETADHDYGNNPSSRKGHEYDIEPADFEGRAGLPNRIVNHYGDNPMDNSDIVETKKTFADYLKEATERQPKFKLTLEKVQHGSWGSTPLSNKVITVSAASEEEAERIGLQQIMALPRKSLANGDHVSWRLAHVQPA